MGEVELVEGGLRGEARELEAAFDSAAVAGLQFQIGQTFQGGGEAKILRRCLPRHRLQVLGHGRQAKLAQFLGQGHRETPFGLSK